MGRLNEQERDKLLYDAEILLMKNKDNCTKDENRRRKYGAAIVATHRDRTYLLTDIDKDTNTGICTCGRPVDICDEPIYCRYCGQRTSGYFGWNSDNYWNEPQ